MALFRSKCLFACAFLFCGTASAQTTPQAPAPNDAASIWAALQKPAFDSAKSANVSGVKFERDRLKFTLTDGVIEFSQPIAGIVHGAAFRGHGKIELDPPNALEAQQLRLHSGQEKLSLAITEATFTFTDGFYEEVATKVQWATGVAGDLSGFYQSRQDERELYNAEIVPRVFKGLLSADRKRTALFVADVKSEKGWLLARLDALNPEEVSLGKWADYRTGKRVDTWVSFPAAGRSSADAWRDPGEKEDFAIKGYKISSTVTGGAEIGATTQVAIAYRAAGERVLLFELDNNLRIESIHDAGGTAFSFFQSRESKDRDAYGEFVAVVLPSPSDGTSAQTLEFKYGGKRVVRKVGNGSYFCQSFGWYPTRPNSFATRAEFEMTFHSPKRFQFVATGDKVSETRDGDWLITTWKSPMPLAVAGFAFGDYKVQTEKVGNIDVEIYANNQPDDNFAAIQQAVDSPLPSTSMSHSSGYALGSLSPSMMAKTMTQEVSNTLRVFEKYFGPYPYKRLAVTNIPYSYGQGWPMLLYLSALSFLDSTQRNQLGIKEHTRITDFFRAHESSHQWWGHKVSWKSYHDQWLSEGFAQFSGNLYVLFRQNEKEYINRLRTDRREMGIGDLRSRRYDSLGPIWMGHRLSSADSPGGYPIVIYNKGGYVLQMIRSMMFNTRAQNPDEREARFQAMMQDFCKTYENKAASTEDFKAVVEKYMTQNMDLDGNHKLDWFFNQYVYGIGTAEYFLRYDVKSTPDGKFRVSGVITRTGVPESWKDSLPLYIYQNGHPARLGWVASTGPISQFDFILPMLPEKLALNVNDDILADVKQ